MVHCKVFWTVLIGLQRVISSTHKLIISAGTLLRLSSQEYHQLQVQDTLEFREGVNVTGQVTCKNTGEGIVAYLEKSHGYVAADVLGKCVGIDLHHTTAVLSFGLN